MRCFGSPIFQIAFFIPLFDLFWFEYVEILSRREASLPCQGREAFEYRVFLLHNTAGNTRSAAAKRGGLIGIVVPACMDHERAALDI